MLQAISARTAFSERWLALRWEPAEGRLTATDPNQLATARTWASSCRRVSIPVLIAVCLSLLLGAALVYFRELPSDLGNWGYPGIFLVQLADSSVMFIPTPGQVYAFAMGVDLNPFLLGVIGGVGAALGELTGYFVGAKARHVLRGGHLYKRLFTLSRRFGGLALFAFAVIPGPFEVANIWAGTVRYPIWRFLLYVGAGKIVKVTCIASAGYYSTSWLFGP